MKSAKCGKVGPKQATLLPTMCVKRRVCFLVVKNVSKSPKKVRLIMWFAMIF